jgi:alanine racemase
MDPREGTVAAVDRAALAHNWAVLRRRAGGRRVIAVVKADAYGHGAVLAARCLVGAGCDHFAVATLGELGALREGGIDAPVLLLGGVRGPADARTALALGATAMLHAEREADWLAAAARELGARARVHVEVDTGMRRLGVAPDEAPALIEKLAASPELELEGVATHYARADEIEDAPTRAQLEVFSRVLEALAARGVPPGLVHVANSAGLLSAQRWGDWALRGSAVRPGLALYGVTPAPHLVDPELRPVMTLRSRVAAVRRVRAGDQVGYGATWRAPGSGWIASVPIGYADGIPWSAANRGELLIAGRRRPIAGRVSMDVTTVWLGEEGATVGQEAVAFGVARSGERLPVEDLARAAGTMPYELLVRIGARVPRVAVS